MGQDYQVACYYFPNYHVDPRNELTHGKGWTEWELVKNARARFENHNQPKIPMWGYEDESDHNVMAKKIEAAADNGITSFIFDWYWYNDKPFLSGALEKGFLNAKNNRRLKFCLMWANHDWIDIHPKKLSQNPSLLYPGLITRESFEKLTDYVIENYFLHPSYWTIDNKPYFSIYELYTLIKSFGSISETSAALKRFREKTKAAGFADLHLNAIIWNVGVLPCENNINDPFETIAALGFDSMTSYVWIHQVELMNFPATEYEIVSNEIVEHWKTLSRSSSLPYYPNVTMGWDPSPRTVQSDSFEQKGYPFSPILKNNTPGVFRIALERAKNFLDEYKLNPMILTLNCWNEWTEGSYLEPDIVNGYAYLKAVKDVFNRI
jgi:hypothetical protein